MNLFQIFCLLALAFGAVSTQAAMNCTDLETNAGLLRMTSDKKVMLDRILLLPKDAQPDGTTYLVETNLKVGSSSETIYRSQFDVKLEKDPNGRPKSVAVEAARYQDGESLGKPVFRPYSHPMSRQYDFAYDSQGNCSVTRVIKDKKEITYDSGLCKNLKDLFNQTFAGKKEEINRCSQVIGQMAAVVETFKKEIPTGLTLSQSMGKNPYKEALEMAADCSGQDSKGDANRGSLDPRPAPKAVSK